MANLYLTHKCYRGCPFCFARKVLRQSSNRDEILTLEEVRQLIDILQGPGGDGLHCIGLLGGEPFVYPHLVELIKLLSARNISPTIFTSATDPLPEGITTLNPKEHRMRFVVNVGTRDTYSDTKYHNLERFFEHFAEVSQLSYTIFDLNSSPSFIFDMIERYGLMRIVRTGIALPIYRGGNTYIPLADYKRAGEYFVRCADEASKRGITMAMDCGFIACMFDDQQLGRLQRLGTAIHFTCGAAVDIGPGLEAWNCFPLFQLGKVDATQAKDLQSLKTLLDNKMAATLPDTPGVLEECADCSMKRRHLCEGGCKSFKSI